MEWLVALVVGVAIGAAVGWLVTQRAIAAANAEAGAIRAELDANKAEVSGARTQIVELERAKAAVEERAAQEHLRVEEQKLMLAQAEARLKDTFNALASQALRSNNDEFLKLAGERLQPVKESLDKMDAQIRAIEQARNQAYGDLTSQVRSLIDSQGELRAETANLAKALRSPTVRGRWGEIQLKRVVELAGMVKWCDFFEQESQDTEEGRRRPDMRVQLPGRKNIVVDAKVPLLAYLESLEAPSEEIRLARLKEHARQVRDHVAALSAKAYWEHLQPTPEFVVLFLPGETFFSAALEQDPSLIEQGATGNVILATPTTLIALLKAVSYGWRQEQLAESAQEICRRGQELHDRVATLVEHLNRIGTSLKRSVEAFNSAAASLETRVLPAARRFKELGVASSKEIEELAQVDQMPLALEAPEPDPPPAPAIVGPPARS